MLIDFHSHIFPDKIADRAIESMQEGMRKQENEVISVCCSPTLNGLKDNMKKSNVDLSVVLPVATSVKQFESINRFAKSVICDNVISFAGVHPMQENIESSLEWVKEQGFKGIKLHPEFQDFYIDSPESISLISRCKALGLLVVFHSGRDIGFSGVHCTPQRLVNVLDKTDGDNLIAAHLGGWLMWDDVLKYIAGSPMYLDTAFLSRYIDKDLCREIIEKHSAKKVLFGSDFPWESPKITYEFLSSLGLSENQMNLICSENAKNLLNI